MAAASGCSLAVPGKLQPRQGQTHWQGFSELGIQGSGVAVVRASDKHPQHEQIKGHGHVP